MNLYDKYDAAAKTIFGISYCDILKNPGDHLRKLLDRYRIDQMVDVAHCLKNMSYDRLVHIINLYLSGSIFFQKFKENFFDIELSSLYEWELLALVHDLSYIYESKEFSADSYSLNDVCTKMGLDPAFLNTSFEPFYSPKTYLNYFKYKLEQFGVCDHGILAGIIFQNKFRTEDPLEIPELSHVIASHNIFVANNKNISLYQKYDLFELIPDMPTFKCIVRQKSKYSYLYLFFCLLDILEPINAFDCVSAEEASCLLKSLDYEVCGKSLKIDVENTSQIEPIAFRIFDIPIWLKVGLNFISDKRIIISI